MTKQKIFFTELTLSELDRSQIVCSWHRGLRPPNSAGFFSVFNKSQGRRENRAFTKDSV